MCEDEKLGPTGDFPNGMLNEDDEGELAIGIGVDNGAIIIHFGEDMGWVGMDPDCARGMAASLRDKANEVEGESFSRASGDCVCDYCGDFYRKHPSDMKQLGVADHTGEPQPFLRVLCDGRRVKL